MKTGELITIYRTEAGMKIEDLAEKSGVPRGTINKMISGDTKSPTYDNIKAVVYAMGKTLDQLAADEKLDSPEDENFSSNLQNRKSPPSPAEPDQREDGRAAVDGPMTVDNLTEMLQAAGYIRPGKDLSENDLHFLVGIHEIVLAWFRQGRESEGECE